MPAAGPSPAVTVPAGMTRAGISRAGPDHLDLLVELNAEYCTADHHEFDPTTAREGLAPLLRDDRHGAVWLVHDRAGDVDGYVVTAWSWSVEIGGAEAVLDEIYVRTRNCGIGAAAIEAIIAECRRRGMRRIVLETERDNDGARRLYTRHGFAADDSIWMSLVL